MRFLKGLMSSLPFSNDALEVCSTELPPMSEAFPKKWRIQSETVFVRLWVFVSAYIYLLGLGCKGCGCCL